MTESALAIKVVAKPPVIKAPKISGLHWVFTCFPCKRMKGALRLVSYVSKSKRGRRCQRCGKKMRPSYGWFYNQSCGDGVETKQMEGIQMKEGKMELAMAGLSELVTKHNVRDGLAGIAELAASIEAVGLLQPIVVRRDQEKGSFVVVDGHRRLAALKALGQKETQVRVVEADTADEAQLAANLCREDLNVLERARGYERMMRLFPKRYNAAVISRRFGTPAKAVERMAALARALDPAADKVLSPAIENFDFEALELLAQLPKERQAAIAAASAKCNGNVVWALQKAGARELDWQCDALKTGELVAAGSAFLLRHHGRESAYTFDAAAHKEAKDAYEAKHSSKYGEESKRAVKATEAESATERAARKKARAALEAARKELPAALKKFLAGKPDEAQIDALGEAICERHLNADSCRRIGAALEVKLEASAEYSGYGIRAVCWRKALRPLCRTAESLARLEAFARRTPGATEADWMKALQEKGKR